MNDMQREIFNNILNSSTKNEIQSLKLALYNNAKGRRAAYEQLNLNLDEFIKLSTVLVELYSNDAYDITKTNIDNILAQEEITLKDSMNVVKNIYDMFTSLRCIMSSSEVQMYQELQDEYNTIIKNNLNSNELEEWNNINMELSILPNILRHPISLHMARIGVAETIDERDERLEEFIFELPSILKGKNTFKSLSNQESSTFFENVEYLMGTEKARQFEISIIYFAFNKKINFLTNLEISEILNFTQWTSLEGKALADYSKIIFNSFSLDDIVLFDSTFLPSYSGKTWVVAKIKQFFTAQGASAKVFRKALLAPSNSKNLNDIIDEHKKLV